MGDCLPLPAMQSVSQGSSVCRGNTSQCCDPELGLWAPEELAGKGSHPKKEPSPGHTQPGRRSLRSLDCLNPASSLLGDIEWVLMWEPPPRWWQIGC